MKRNYFCCHLSSLSENCTFFWICCPSSFTDFWRGWVFPSVPKCTWNSCPSKRSLLHWGPSFSAWGHIQPVECRFGGRCPRCPEQVSTNPFPPSCPHSWDPKATETSLAFVIYTWFFTFSLCKPFLTGKSAAWTRKKKGKSGYWLVLFLLFQQGFQWSHSKFRLAVQGSFVVYFN